MESYRAYIDECLLKGEKIQYVYAEHCYSQVLEQLKEMAKQEKIEDVNHLRKDGEEQELLWIIQSDEVVEKGIYSLNRPKEEMLVLAPPALMALLIGEYELSIKLCELVDRSYLDDRATEILQDVTTPLLNGGVYDFCEACILSFDMSLKETQYFLKKGFFNVSHYHQKKFFSDVIFHGGSQSAWKFVYKLLERMQQQEGGIEDLKVCKILIVIYAFTKKMDMQNKEFWKELYELLSSDSEWVMGVAHHYFFNHNGMGEEMEECRVITGMEEYFRHEEGLNMDGVIGRYVVQLLREEVVYDERGRNYCRKYFETVKRFKGNYTTEWKEAILRMLRKRDFILLELAFQNHFICEECVEECIEFFISKKEYSWVLPYLIQKNWLIKGKVNGNL